MGSVRLDDGNPREYEVGGYCRECGENVYVLPPKKIRDVMDAIGKGDFDKEADVDEWTGEKHFCCPTCQKEHDLPEVE